MSNHMKNIKIPDLTKEQKEYIRKIVEGPKNLDNATKSRAGVMIEGHFKIYDPETGEVFIGQRDIQGGDGP